MNCVETLYVVAISYGVFKEAEIFTTLKLSLKHFRSLINLQSPCIVVFDYNDYARVSWYLTRAR